MQKVLISCQALPKKTVSEDARAIKCRRYFVHHEFFGVASELFLCKLILD